MFGFDLITDIPTTNKTIFFRCDFDVPLNEDGEILDDEKIRKSLPTINYLIKTGSRVVIATHIGKPQGKFNYQLSTKVIYKYLQKHLRCDVYFCDDCIGEKTKKEIFKASYGSVVILENLKFYPEEEQCDLTFARELSDGMNIYVNDCLSCSHLQYASILGVPLFVRPTAGTTLNNEVNTIKSVLIGKNITAIVGGNKFLSKVDLLNNLIEIADYLIIVGGIANTFFQAIGKNVGKSLRDIECEEIILDFFNKAKKTGCKIILPVDVVVAKDIINEANTKTKLIEKLTKDDIIVDIGEKTLYNIEYLLSISKNVIWYGSACINEIGKFSYGNINICKMISHYTKTGKIKSIVGGRNVILTIKQQKQQDNFSFISNSNQSFLNFLSGKILPGLEILHRLSIENNKGTF